MCMPFISVEPGYFQTKLKLERRYFGIVCGTYFLHIIGILGDSIVSISSVKWIKVGLRQYRNSF